MSVSAAQAAAFYSEALKDERVYAVRDDCGFPAPLGRSGRRAMPFWSKRSRAQKIIDSALAYREFLVVEIGLADWIEKWLPDLQQDGIDVGVNWSGRFGVRDFPSGRCAEHRCPPRTEAVGEGSA